MDGDGIEVVQFLSTSTNRRDQVRFLQDGEVFRYRLSRQVQSRAELDLGLTVFEVQAIEKPPATGIRECSKDEILGRHAKGPGDEFDVLLGEVGRLFINPNY